MLFVAISQSQQSLLHADDHQYRLIQRFLILTVKESKSLVEVIMSILTRNQTEFAVMFRSLNVNDPG